MKIKRYIAPDIRRAIRMVRQEQGPDAVILSNRKVAGGVEIVAAIDYDERVLSTEEVSGKTSEYTLEKGYVEDDAVTLGAEPKAKRDQRAMRERRQTQLPENWIQDPALVEMRNELKDLRNLLESQLSGLAWGDLERRHPLHARLVRNLMGLGLDAAVCRDLVTDIPAAISFEQAWLQALAILANRIAVTNDDILTQGGIVALVGPTGVGKTTTIAKLAARYTLRHGKNTVALISTDGFRVGAHEQLRIYGRILGAPVMAATTTQELYEAINSHLDKGLILIDTAGFSPQDRRVTEQLSMFNDVNSHIRHYLVLSATTQMQGINTAVRQYQGLELSGTVLTKLDEAGSLGPVLSAAVKYALPVAYVSDGQKVPEDLHPARANNLANACVTILKGRHHLPEAEAVEMEYGSMVVNSNV